MTSAKEKYLIERARTIRKPVPISEHRKKEKYYETIEELKTANNIKINVQPKSKFLTELMKEVPNENTGC